MCNNGEKTKKQVFPGALQFNRSWRLPLLPRWLPISQIYLIRMNSWCSDCCALQVSFSAQKCFFFLFFFLNSAVLSYSTNDLHGNQSYPKNAKKTVQTHSITPTANHLFCTMWLVRWGFEGSDLINFLFQSYSAQRVCYHSHFAFQPYIRERSRRIYY